MRAPRQFRACSRFSSSGLPRSVLAACCNPDPHLKGSTPSILVRHIVGGCTRAAFDPAPKRGTAKGAVWHGTIS